MILASRLRHTVRRDLFSVQKNHFFKYIFANPNISSQTEYQVTKWHNTEGGYLKPGSTLCDITTNNTSVGVMVQEGGVLAKVLVKEGDRAKSGDPIGIRVDDEADYDEFLKLSPSDYSDYAQFSKT
mmetsp:Transcript_4042/g.6268  ORF Transcript_4042/g.6268 Transcript_4042/m.6268 type:complete len:126 (+) Transcript_4042:109-486(+)|eukprot:CAMPEP_0185028440 /NCGR_PEP_ID=MMETSP1103-20130426/14157_1 /TAXON_ID=36769 /ORGANISM="Paraphysomonas bandaiensis, Strain Caron Lab Isolate" /LENGTH=125 /DNA_ID=CAMNT_0027562865 /DNA_START=76 /DNA_END=453 /DNA_ORIENTATION=+